MRHERRPAPGGRDREEWVGETMEEAAEAPGETSTGEAPASEAPATGAVAREAPAPGTLGPDASAAPDTGGVRGFSPERQEQYPVAGGAVEAADRRADEESEAAEAHEPLGPGGFVEERDVTGGPATAFADRDNTDASAGSAGAVLEGPETGPVLTVGPATRPARTERTQRREEEFALGSRWLEPLATTLQHTRTWIRDVGLALGSSDPRTAWLALRVVLTTLRDQLTVAEVADLGATLPIPLRGIYLEGWHGRPEQVADREAFLAVVEQRLGRDAEIDAETAVRAVLSVLRERVPRGEFGDLRSVLPLTLKGLVE